MKEKYLTPEIKKEVFEMTDVITSSTELDWDDDLRKNPSNGVEGIGL